MLRLVLGNRTLLIGPIRRSIRPVNDHISGNPARNSVNLRVRADMSPPNVALTLTEVTMLNAEAAPEGRPSLISRVIQPSHSQQWCEWAFPPGKYSSIPKSPDVERWNSRGGYEIAADRLALVDGGEDPWAYA